MSLIFFASVHLLSGSASARPASQICPGLLGLKGVQSTDQFSDTPPIRIAARDWLSAEIVAHLLSIALEMGGYRSVLVDMTGRSSSLIWECDISHSACSENEKKFMVDVDPESWRSGDKQYQKWVKESKQVFDAGPVGYVGHSGLYFSPSQLIDKHPTLLMQFAGAHKAIKQVSALFPRLSLADSDTGASLGVPWSEEYPSWLERGLVDESTGRWIPSHCQPQGKCGQIYHKKPSWDTGILESLVVTHEMPYEIHYLGDSYSLKIQDHFAKLPPRPVLHYWYTPDPLLNLISSDRVVFPTFRVGCSGNPGVTYRECDFEASALTKFASSQLRWGMPRAYALYSKFEIGMKDITALMSEHTLGGGDISEARQIACNFAKANDELLWSWVTSCGPETVFDQERLMCVPECALGSEVSMDGQSCVPCAVGRYQPAIHTACVDCSQGTYSSEVGSTICNACLPGWAASKSGGDNCTACGKGQFAPKPGATACQSCIVGKYNSELAKSACSSCPIGKFAAVDGSEECQSCVGKGVTTAWVGATSEDDCLCPPNMYFNGRRKPTYTRHQRACVSGHNIIKYSGKTVEECIQLCDASSECRAFEYGVPYDGGGGNFQAGDCQLQSSANMAGCDGSYYNMDLYTPDVGGSNECLPCMKDYMICQESYGKNAFLLKEGFMSALHEPGEVYRCAHLDGCRGTRDPFDPTKSSVCTNYHTGPTCFKCQEGFATRGDRCVSCLADGEGSEGFWFLPPVNFRWDVVLGFVIIVTSCTKLFDNSLKPPTAERLLWGLLIGFVQGCAVVSGYDVSWPSPVLSLFSIGEGFEFDVSVLGLRPECVTGGKFHMRLLGQMMWPLFLQMGFAFVYGFWKVFGHGSKFSSRYPPEMILESVLSRLRLPEKYLEHASILKAQASKRFAGFWPITADNMLNCMQKAHFGLFISVLSISLAIFNCTEHPNERKTVTKYPDVGCGSKEWWYAFPIGLLSVLVYCVGFASWVIYLVRVAPLRVATDKSFAKRYRFIWAKWHPGKWWFSLIQLGFATLLNLNAIFAANGYQQVYFASTLITLYMVLLNNIKPWKFISTTIVDCCMKFALSLMCLFATAYVETTEEGLAFVRQQFVAFILFIPVCPVLLTLGYLFFTLWRKHYATQEDAVERMLFAQRFRDIMSMATHLSNSDFNKLITCDLVDNDRQQLLGAMDVLTSVVLKMQPGPKWQQRRIIAGHPYIIADNQKIDEAIEARGIHESPAVAERRLLQRMAKLLANLAPVRTPSKDGSSSQPGTTSENSSPSKRNSLADIARASITSENNFMQPKINYKKVFEALDVNADGSLSETEFVAALRRLIDTELAKEAQASTGLEVFDMDGNGVINDEDLAAIFKIVDVDDSGDVSSNEFCAVLRVAEASNSSKARPRTSVTSLKGNQILPVSDPPPLPEPDIEEGQLTNDSSQVIDPLASSPPSSKQIMEEKLPSLHEEVTKNEHNVTLNSLQFSSHTQNGQSGECADIAFENYHQVAPDASPAPFKARLWEGNSKIGAKSSKPGAIPISLDLAGEDSGAEPTSFKPPIGTNRQGTQSTVNDIPVASMTSQSVVAAVTSQSAAQQGKSEPELLT